MKAAECFLETARRYAEREAIQPGACDELCRVHPGARWGNSDDVRYGLRYNASEYGMKKIWEIFERFEPEQRDDDLYWWSPHTHDARIIALCLAAAIANSPHK